MGKFNKKEMGALKVLTDHCDLEPVSGESWDDMVERLMDTDYLSVNTGVGAASQDEFVWYCDEKTSAAVRISDGKIFDDEYDDAKCEGVVYWGADE